MSYTLYGPRAVVCDSAKTKSGDRSCGAIAAGKAAETMVFGTQEGARGMRLMAKLGRGALRASGRRLEPGRCQHGPGASGRICGDSFSLALGRRGFSCTARLAFRGVRASSPEQPAQKVARCLADRGLFFLSSVFPVSPARGRRPNPVLPLFTWRGKWGGGGEKGKDGAPPGTGRHGTRGGWQKKPVH